MPALVPTSLEAISIAFSFEILLTELRSCCVTGSSSLSKEALFAKPLAAEITKENFVFRDVQEKRRTLIALARTAGPSCLEFMQQIIDSSGVSDSHDELRIAALYVIAELRDPKGQKFLKELSEKLFVNKLLKATAQRLIRTPQKAEEFDIA